LRRVESAMMRRRPGRSSGANYRNLLRFYGYALRYWPMMVVALLAMLVSTAATFHLLLLIKPVVRSFGGHERAAEVIAAPNVAAQVSEDPVGGRSGDSARAAQAGSPRGPGRMPWSLLGRVRRFLVPSRDAKMIALVLACVTAPILFISGYVNAVAMAKVVWTILADVRTLVFERVCSFSLGYFSKIRTGDLLSRLTNDLRMTRQAVRLLVGPVVIHPLKLVLLVAFALYSSVHLTLVAVCVLPLILISLRVFGRRIRRAGRRMLECLADVSDLITQVLGGIRVVKCFNMEAAECEQLRLRNQAQVDAALKLTKTRALAGGLPALLILIAAAGGLATGEYLVDKRMLTLGKMLQCSGALWLAAGALRRSVGSWNDLQESMPGLNRIFELVDARAEIEDRPGAVAVQGVRDGVRFEGVCFAYDSTPVLKDVSLFAPRGRMCAIVGEMGAGKTTMLDLILRLYDVQSGSIMIDGLDVRDIQRQSLLQQIAVVSQHPFLFSRPIAENIRYGKPDATDEEVVAAARAANIHELIESLPDGYQTQVGEGGTGFSGGQRQCITIARAIIKDAPVLLLDEATASLDPASERLVQQALLNLIEGRTTFVIAHRIRTVQDADQIIVLKDGEVVQRGTHAELLRQGGEYQRLYGRQFADTPEQPVGDDGRQSGPRPDELTSPDDDLGLALPDFDA
jgi:subfamily B ATP-binding cassette protein MsbA